MTSRSGASSSKKTGSPTPKQKNVADAIKTTRGTVETVNVTAELRDYDTALHQDLGRTVLPESGGRIAHAAAATTPTGLARTMLSVAPTRAPVNRMAEQVGPEYYDTKGAATVLAGPGTPQVSEQAVEHRRKQRTILALPTAEGRWIYPTWQFVDRDLLPGLVDVLAVFDAVGATSEAQRDQPSVPPYSQWSVATWLTTPREVLDGLTAVQWLQRNPGDPELAHALRTARRAATAWSA